MPGPPSTRDPRPGRTPVRVWRAERTLVDAALWLASGLAAATVLAPGPAPDPGSVALALATMVTLKAVAGWAADVPRRTWRTFGLADARALTIAVAAATTAATVLFAAVPALGVPAGVAIVDGLLTTAAMLTVRGLSRQAADDAGAGRAPTRRTRDVLIVGAGSAGALLVREMRHHPESGMRPVGFLDDDPRKRGHRVASTHVLGTTDELARILARTPADEVLIAIPSAGGATIRRIVERVHAAAPGLPVRTMPALHELISGRVQIQRIRDVTIDDLLRRAPVELDTAGIEAFLRGARVLVTGAGGSIGSELVRQICRFEPGELILFGHGENSIYQLERELDATHPEIPYVSVIGQVQNAVRLRDVLRRHRPDIVYHTAAHKHVPLMESNPEEVVFNNVIGSRNLVEAALAVGVRSFVNVSTDKAVAPTSVMGASKRIVEMIVQAASRRAAPGQVFVSVRFGNVLGSRGSAVPIFQRQIAAGGPVTVTDPEMVRYFMTIPEATRLVLQASAIGRNGEIYILDMGRPVRVVDLATDLIRLSGLEPGVDVRIVFTGRRPGEKLREELTTAREGHGRTSHDKILVTRPAPVDEARLGRTIDALVEAALASDGAAIRRLLNEGIDDAHLAATSPPHPSAVVVASASSDADASPDPEADAVTAALAGEDRPATM